MSCRVKTGYPLPERWDLIQEGVQFSFTGHGGAVEVLERFAVIAAAPSSSSIVQDPFRVESETTSPAPNAELPTEK